MLDMLKRHQIQVLRDAGHSQQEVAKLATVSVRSVRRVEAEVTVTSTGLSAVQKALAGLERDGLVVGRTVGRTRLVTLNPRYFAIDALRGYLARLAEPETELERRLSALRRRPRLTGKPL